MSLSFSDDFQNSYNDINWMYEKWDVQWLREKRQELFNEETTLICSRAATETASYKERALINLNLSDVHNLVALVSRRINELMDEEKFYNPEI